MSAELSAIEARLDEQDRVIRGLKIDLKAAQKEIQQGRLKTDGIRTRTGMLRIALAGLDTEKVQELHVKNLENFHNIKSLIEAHMIKLEVFGGLMAMSTGAESMRDKADLAITRWFYRHEPETNEWWISKGHKTLTWWWAQVFELQVVDSRLLRGRTNG